MAGHGWFGVRKGLWGGGQAAQQVTGMWRGGAAVQHWQPCQRPEEKALPEEAAGVPLRGCGRQVKTGIAGSGRFHNYCII